MNRLSPNASLWLTLARIYLGAYWLIHGLSKLLNHSALRIPQWYHGMLAGPVTQNMRWSEPAISITETLVGLLLVLGLLTRASALGAAALGAGFLLTKGVLTDYTVVATGAAAITVLALVIFALAPGFGIDHLSSFARERSARRVQRVRATPVNVKWPD
ncbi:MAG: DoxX family membrane protein [Candidatus Eremiobacteraeota bacterium]|nr:DoxX family membrane protein [Candidatus Eremiobacteraeota bacterium]